MTAKNKQRQKQATTKNTQLQKQAMATITTEVM